MLVLTAVVIKGLPLTVEFLRNSPVLLFPEPLEYTIVGISVRSRSAPGRPTTSVPDVAKTTKV